MRVEVVPMVRVRSFAFDDGALRKVFDQLLLCRREACFGGMCSRRHQWISFRVDALASAVIRD